MKKFGFNNASGKRGGGSKFKALAAAFAAVVIAVPCAVSPVFANSGPVKEVGITGGGVLIRNENSVLAVESEKLTFDIPDFPREIYEDGTSADYGSRVTAEYKFVNTSDNTVRTSMAFPLGNVEEYYYHKQFSIDATVLVNGRETEAETRHTLGRYDYNGSFDEGVAQISDEWYEDGFYKPDMPVTTYSVSLDASGYNTVVATAKVTSDNIKAKYLCPYGYSDEIEFYFNNWGGGQKQFFVIGDKDAISFDWKTEESKFIEGWWFLPSRVERCEIDVPVEVTEVVDKDGRAVYPTLKDLVLSFRHDESVISDLDYYNGVANTYFFRFESSISAGEYGRFPYYDDEFCTWYTYDVEVESHGSIINTVTAPLVPTVQMLYTPYIYTYDYYLSPARGWASFGTLDVEINTPYYSQGMPSGFVKSENGFSAHYDRLPEGELSFSLCASQNPSEYKYYGNWVMTIIIFYIGIVGVLGVVVMIAFIIFMIVYAVKRSKKRKTGG